MSLGFGVDPNSELTDAALEDLLIACSKADGLGRKTTPVALVWIRLMVEELLENRRAHASGSGSWAFCKLLEGKTVFHGARLGNTLVLDRVRAVVSSSWRGMGPPTHYSVPPTLLRPGGFRVIP